MSEDDAPKPYYPDLWLLEETLGRADVARIFKVDPATVSGWAKRGMIGFFRTPAGTRVFPEAEVKRIMRGDPPPDYLRINADYDNGKYQSMWKKGWRKGGVGIANDPNNPDSVYYKHRDRDD